MPPSIQHDLFWVPSTKEMVQTEKSSKVPWEGFSSGTCGEVRPRALIGFVYSRMRRLSQGDPPAIGHRMKSLREGRRRHRPETHNANQEVTITGLYNRQLGWIRGKREASDHWP